MCFDTKCNAWVLYLMSKQINAIQIDFVAELYYINQKLTILFEIIIENFYFDFYFIDVIGAS